MKPSPSPHSFWQRVGFDMNLASLRFRHIHNEYGGPVLGISVREKNLADGNYFEAFVDLKPDLVISQPHTLYGSAHGMGSDTVRANAIYKALSEAMERWAWSSSTKDLTGNSLLGLDIDSSSDGFAAFPGLTGIQARQNALYESWERWSIRAWWEGKTTHKVIPISKKNVGGICLASGPNRLETIILWEKVATSKVAYGFACSSDLASAEEHAWFELQRNKQILSTNQTTAPQSALERRVLYFASPAGHERFLKKIGNVSTTALAMPSLIVDARVPGPWSAYAQVHRCLFDISNLAKDKGEEDYFSF